MTLFRLFLLSIILSINASLLFAAKASIEIQSTPPAQIESPKNISERFPKNEYTQNCPIYCQAQSHAKIWEEQVNSCNDKEYGSCCLLGLKQRGLYLYDGIVDNPKNALLGAAFCACSAISLTAGTLACSSASAWAGAGTPFCCDNICCKQALDQYSIGGTCCAASGCCFVGGVLEFINLTLSIVRFPLNLLAPEIQSMCGQHHLELFFAKKYKAVRDSINQLYTDHDD